jgi:hypothetical protein
MLHNTWMRHADVHLVRGLLIMVVVCVLLVGCGPPQLSQHAASVICLGLAKGGDYQTAAGAAAEDGITDPTEARTAIRDAVRDHCPAYLGTVGDSCGVLLPAPTSRSSAGVRHPRDSAPRPERVARLLPSRARRGRVAPSARP